MKNKFYIRMDLMNSKKMIVRINFSSRMIEKVYNSIKEIDKNEYDIKKIILCCEGRLVSYGGLYTDNIIWRYVSDIPFLKSNFDFLDKDVNLFKIANPSNTDYNIDCASFHFKIKENNESYEYNCKNQYKYIPNMINNYGFIDYNEKAIAQIKNNKVILIYPHIRLIPSYIFNIKKIYPVYKDNVVEYSGFTWVKYSELIKLINTDYLYQNNIMG